MTGVMLGSELTVILSLFHIFLSVALASLSLSTILKITIFIGALGQKLASATPSERPQVLPRVTVLIPWLEEPRILHHLFYYLQRLDYPRTHLEVMLILEDGDVETQTALLAAKLPSWCCVITVPKWRVKTKPRALNFALGFSRGDIVGVLDAEDADLGLRLSLAGLRCALLDSKTCEEATKMPLM